MRILAGALTTILLILLFALGFIYSGVYDISAAKPHSPLSAWILSKTMENSVRTRSSGINVPPEFEKTSTERVYFVYYSICALCHGGAGAVARGLNPYAPDLSEAAPKLSPAAVFWIVKNGIKMTGMPAFGKTYRDDEIWILTAFVKQLPAGKAERP